MEEKKFYYSEDPVEEARFIEELGVPDYEYEKALKKVLTVDYKDMTTNELYNLVLPLESEEYFTGYKNTREFFIQYIEWQRMKERDAGQFVASFFNNEDEDMRIAKDKDVKELKEELRKPI